VSSIAKLRSWWLDREVAPDVALVVAAIAGGQGSLDPAVAIGPKGLRPLVETIGVLGDEPDLDR
jgi:hypothetical protein